MNHGMKMCYYKKLEAHWAACIDCVDVHFGKNSAWSGVAVTRIYVPYHFRGQGIARELFNELLAEADRCQVKLYLEIAPYNDGERQGLSFEELESWYRRHGFTGLATGWLVRKPKPV